MFGRDFLAYKIKNSYFVRFWWYIYFFIIFELSKIKYIFFELFHHVPCSGQMAIVSSFWRIPQLIQRKKTMSNITRMCSMLCFKILKNEKWMTMSRGDCLPYIAPKCNQRGGVTFLLYKTFPSPQKVCRSRYKNCYRKLRVYTYRS